MAAGPQPGQQQGAVGVPQWQLLYEQFWNQQQAVQLLQAAQQLLLVFPQQPVLLQLVQRLQEELMVWGESGSGSSLPYGRTALMLQCCWCDLAAHLQPGECVQHRAG